jgi:hypothetical protein
VEQSLIEIGTEYGLRERVQAGELLERIRVLERVRSGRWRVEWLEGDREGLKDFVKSKNIIVPWRERRAFLRDEEKARVFNAHVERTAPPEKNPIHDAMNTVFESTGDAVSYWNGALTGEQEALERVANRAQAAIPDSPYVFVDRFGTTHLPFEIAVALAQAFAAAEPESVLLAVDTQQRKYETEAREPGSAFLVPLVNEWRASWALVRQWAGHDQALAAKDAETKRLRELIERAAWDLRRDGADPERVANKMLRALAGA